MGEKKKTTDFDLKDEDKKEIIDAIILFFEEERGEKIGVIAAESLLDFFLENLGKRFYNKALDDAKLWFEQRLEFMESDFYTMYKNTD